MRCCSAAMDILLAATPESPPAAPFAGFASTFCNRFMRSLQHTMLQDGERRSVGGLSMAAPHWEAHHIDFHSRCVLAEVTRQSSRVCRAK